MEDTLPNHHMKKRVRLLGGIAAVFVLLGSAWALYWLLALRHTE